MQKEGHEPGDKTCTYYTAGHLVSPLVCRGPWMSTVVLYCWCHSDRASVLSFLKSVPFLAMKYPFSIINRAVFRTATGSYAMERFYRRMMVKNVIMFMRTENTRRVNITLQSTNWKTISSYAWGVNMAFTDSFSLMYRVLVPHSLTVCRKPYINLLHLGSPPDCRQQPAHIHSTNGLNDVLSIYTGYFKKPLVLIKSTIILIMSA